MHYYAKYFLHQLWIKSSFRFFNSLPKRTLEDNDRIAFGVDDQVVVHVLEVDGFILGVVLVCRLIFGKHTFPFSAVGFDCGTDSRER